MTLDEYKQKYASTDDAPGWEAIDARLSTIYPTQQPTHMVPPIHAAMGGSEPLDGISIYDSNAGGIAHRHLVTYGFSELYVNEAAFGKEFSKFGFELTFRLKPFPADSEVPHWAVNMLQNIAKYVFKSGNWFEPYDIMPAKGPIRLDTDTAIHAMIFVPDAELDVVQTLHGEVRFLQIFGITQKEFDETNMVHDNVVALADRHRKTNPLLVTNLERKDPG